MSRLIKVFFGLIDNEKLLKSQNFERGFWSFEEDCVLLSEPISWKHGVYQYFSIGNDEFWSTLTGEFIKKRSDNFIEIKNELTKIHNDFNSIYKLIELITLGDADLFDVIDEFDQENILIEKEKGLGFQFINLENYGFSNINKNNSIWIFEVLKYDGVSSEIKNNKIKLLYESSEDLNLTDRFSLSVLLKK